MNHFLYVFVHVSQPAQKGPLKSVTYWRIWVPQCMSVDKIEKLVSFGDTCESDRSDLFSPYLYVVIHMVRETLSSISVKPIFFPRHFSEDRKQTDQNDSKIQRQQPKLICYVSFHISYYHVHPVYLCRGRAFFDFSWDVGAASDCSLLG